MKRDFNLVVRVLLLVLGCILFFQQDLQAIFGDALRNDTVSYILFIPFLFAFLVYRKRDMVRASLTQASKSSGWTLQFDEGLGLIFLAFSFLLYFYGSYTFTPVELHLMALPIFVAGGVLFLFNGRVMRELLFPTLFLFLLTPPPQEYLYHLGAFLSMISASFAYYFLRLLPIPVSFTMAQGIPVLRLFPGNGEPLFFAVDVACSGLHSQLGFLTFALFAAALLRGEPWKKTLLLGLGFPLMYLLNGLRITLLAVLGVTFGGDMALSLFHLTGGWLLAVLGTILLLFMSERVFGLHIALFDPSICSIHTFLKASHFCVSCGEIVAAPSRALTRRDSLKGAAVLGCVLLFLTIQIPIFALTEGPAEFLIQTVHGAEATTEIFPPLSGYQSTYRSDLSRNVAWETHYGLDATLAYELTPTSPDKTTVWIALEISESRSNLHRWESCLWEWPSRAGEPVRVTPEELYDVVLQEDPFILGRFFIFTWNDNTPQVTLYWYADSIFESNSTLGYKYMKVSLVAYPENLGTLTSLKQELIDIAVQIVTSWQSVKTSSKAALFLRENTDALLVFLAILTGIYLLLHLYSRLGEIKRRQRVYRKLPKRDRTIIDAVHHTLETGPLPTFTAIKKTYDQLNGHSIAAPTLLARLQSTEETRVIKSAVANRNDTPIQIWLTDFTLFENRYLQRVSVIKKMVAGFTTS